MEIHLHQGDLPDGLDWGPSIAVDTETRGLRLGRDRLCLVQLARQDGVCHLVKFDADNFNAPNLQALLANPDITKIFHFARFDLTAIRAYLGVWALPVYCTKIASRLVRTYTDRHGLAALCKELLDIDLSKFQQSSDWAAAELSAAQIEYAASDVLHLHRLKARLDEMLAREGRTVLAQECFNFLRTRCRLDIIGWPEEDIFSH